MSIELIELTQAGEFVETGESTSANVADSIVSFRERRGRLSEWTGRHIDPHVPTFAEPGTSEKVITLAARYAAGLPLWNDADRDSHNPLDDDDEN